MGRALFIVALLALAGGTVAASSVMMSTPLGLWNEPAAWLIAVGTGLVVAAIVWVPVAALLLSQRRRHRRRQG